MKHLGIIGGVGPDTTSEVYLSVLRAIKSSGSKHYPAITIYNLPFPYRLEREAIAQGKNPDEIVPYLIEGARTLERAGADIGILPCNSLHRYIQTIRKSVNLPFLSILEESAFVLQKHQKRSIGILGTEMTVRSGLYAEAFTANDIQIIYPARKSQDRLNQMILELLGNQPLSSHATTLQDLCFELEQGGSEAILLACSDLQLIKSPQSTLRIPLFDTTHILINACVQHMLGSSS